jgi:hypothetical protein
VTPEELRRGALATLGPHADPRARQTLERAELVVIEAGTSWEGARARVTGMRVGLGVTPEDLAALEGAHAVKDALVAAVAAAIAVDGVLALTDLVPYWSPAARAEAALYRGALGPDDLGAAVVHYLRAKGEHEASELAKATRFTVAGDEVTALPSPPPIHVAKLDAAVRALLSGLTQKKVRLRHGGKRR